MRSVLLSPPPPALTLGSGLGPQGPAPRLGHCRVPVQGKGLEPPTGSKVSEVTQGLRSNPQSPAGPGASAAQATLNGLLITCN